MTEYSKLDGRYSISTTKDTPFARAFSFLVPPNPYNSHWSKSLGQGSETSMGHLFILDTGRTTRTPLSLGKDNTIKRGQRFWFRAMLKLFEIAE